jgi:hypothetical protein
MSIGGLAAALGKEVVVVAATPRGIYEALRG